MTIPSSSTAMTNKLTFTGGDTKQNHQKTSPAKSKNTVKRTSTTGIQVKRKPSLVSNNNKKGKKPVKAVATVSSIDLEATICPICDEACTCPKTNTTANSSNNATVKSNNPSATNKTPSNKTKGKTFTKKPAKKPISSKPKYLNKPEEYEEDDFEDEEDADESEGAIEDPALSFIRMIYSDEESLDEEEAYALYQATQLFSSSDEEEEGEGEFDDEEEGYFSDSDISTSDEEEDDDDEYEYTVVEYVQPPSRKNKRIATSEFVAYESGSDFDNEDGNNDNEGGNLLLNAEISEQESTGTSDGTTEQSQCSNEDSDDENNWLTYSVFDVDRDIILTQQQQQQQQVNSQSQQQFVTLSSHGSGTPETLLFSTSSTDKIPNIAPQVLAAISAAAKHMANSHGNNHNHNGGNGNGTSKYFSYITLKDPLRPVGPGEDVNEEEFLFFEEPDEPSDDSSGMEEYDSEIDMEVDLIENSDDEEDGEEEREEEGNELDSSEDVDIEELSAVKKLQISSKHAPSTASSSTSTPTTISSLPLNRWSRVPIGAFRRSRRPSIPNHYHHIHPSAALKTFTDPTAAALTLSAAPGNGEDSFDEGNTHSNSTSNNNNMTVPDHFNRARSVVTWEELDMDIVNPLNPSTGSSPPPHNNIWPLPKRSRSVMAPFSNEWLNSSNWNWEM